MATSAALNYALNNGMTQEQYYKNIFDYVANNRGLNDVQLKAEMTRLGVSPEDVANATGVPLAGVQSRFNAATGTGTYVAPTDVAQSVGVTYGLNNNMTQAQIDKNIFDFVANNRGLNDVQLAAEMDRLGFNANDVARATGVDYAGVLARYNAAKTGVVQPPVVVPPVVPPVVVPPVVPPVVRPPVVPPVVTQPPGLLTTPMPTGATSIAGTLPFANATQGFAQNFRNYTSIPIGMQYNPNVMGGQQQQSPTGQSAALTWGLNNGMTQAQIDKNIFDFVDKNRSLSDVQLRKEMDKYGISPTDVARATGVPVAGVQSRYDIANSPYSQVMDQMRPVGNPYATFVAGTPMGGYNPGLYDQILAANAAKAKADADAAANKPVEVAGSSGVAGQSQESINDSVAAANAAAAVTGESVSVSGETGESVSGIYNKGGIVDGLFGMNPPGPDDGAGYLDRGEYVIRKSSVNKYGRGLLDMINEGKVPAKKMKSLLG